MKTILNKIKLKLKNFRGRTLSNVKYAQSLGVKIGNNCLIGTRNWSSEPYLIEIGNNCQITKDVMFHTHGGSHICRLKYPNFDTFGKIVVHDNSYIGARSQIMSGVTIGEGTLVAAGSIVTKSTPPHTVVAGNPARIICTTDEFIERQLPYNLNTKSMSAEEKKQYLMSLPDDAFIKK